MTCYSEFQKLSQPHHTLTLLFVNIFSDAFLGVLASELCCQQARGNFTSKCSSDDLKDLNPQSLVGNCWHRSDSHPTFWVMVLFQVVVCSFFRSVWVKNCLKLIICWSFKIFGKHSFVVFYIPPIHLRWFMHFLWWRIDWILLPQELKRFIQYNRETIKPQLIISTTVTCTALRCTVIR